MATKYMRSNNRVSADFNKVAVQRGPIIYAAEEADNGKFLWTYNIDSNVEAKYEFQSDLLNGVGSIYVKSIQTKVDSVDSSLYMPLTEKVETNITSLKLIPYYSWANRLNGQMSVWLNRKN